MEEHMGRRTVGGLILTRAGSILVYRDEKENSSHINKRNQDHPKKCKQVHMQSSQKRNAEPSKRTNSTSHAETRGKNVNLASRINKRVSSITKTVSQIQGSLRGRNGNSRGTGSSSSSSSTVIKRQEERLVGNGDGILSRQERNSRLHGNLFRPNERRVAPYYEERGVNASRTSTEDDIAYWNFNIDDTSERFLEQETSSFLDDRSWPDRHREMRMDIDDMSYEELVAFCERIGTVNTGLSDSAMSECLERSLYAQTNSQLNLVGTKEEGDIKCIICQEEYSFGEEVGKMLCKHFYHVNCIHQWLRLKNWCPICKALASPSS
ncbi:RING/U-box superfamily protein [Rhynchospora pubera]|uniref:RING-type E3 ubiquitin transferase n=1 Tax=Rhynchospora pubera TaxID=906938 RepID=A0AAV8CJE7_9POAL|nr:RING/U-box superfamily protein [Rhynchospora pubera]